MAAEVPGPLRLVESFLNSIDVESGADDLRTAATFHRWLGNHDQHTPPPTERDTALARELRTELRAEVAAHHDGEPRSRARLNTLAAQIPLTARFAPDGAATPAPAGTGTTGFLGTILAAVTLASHDGSWRRLKLCPADDCREVYYDHSRNSSRRWCSMDVCGNRNKTRAYRRRVSGTG